MSKSKKDRLEEVKKLATWMGSKAAEIDLEEKEVGFISEQARDPSTNTGILKILSISEDESIRADVAANPSTSIEILRRLSDDDDSDVRLAVAANENTPIDVLEVLSRDPDIYVKDEARHNLNSRGCERSPC